MQIAFEDEDVSGTSAPVTEISSLQIAVVNHGVNLDELFLAGGRPINRDTLDVAPIIPIPAGITRAIQRIRWMELLRRHGG